jgi:uncharacterized protein YjbI with pentapeptide repeats
MAVRKGTPRSLENVKLASEISLLKSQKKLFDQQVVDLKRPKDKESFVKKYSGFGTFIVALVALGTLILNLVNDRLNYLKAEDEKIVKYISELASHHFLHRASAVKFLSPHATKNSGDESILASLFIAYSNESSHHVRRQMLEVFKKVPGVAARELLAIREINNANSIPLIIEWANAVGNLEKAKVEREKHADLSKLRDRISEKHKEVRRAQWAAIYAADALRHVACKQSSCAIDLSNMWLRSVSFSGQQIDLTRANFKGASLFATDFFDEDLAGAELSGLRLTYVNFENANLEGANLQDTIFRIVPDKISERERENCIWHNGTNFRNTRMAAAQLEGARFEVSDFSGSDVTADQLRSAATFQGAILSSELAKELAHENPANLKDCTERK